MPAIEDIRKLVEQEGKKLTARNELKVGGKSDRHDQPALSERLMETPGHESRVVAVTASTGGGFQGTYGPG